MVDGRSSPSVPDLEPDPVIDAYKKDVDRTLLRENLKRSVEERLRDLMRLQKFAHDEVIAELEALLEERGPRDP